MDNRHREAAERIKVMVRDLNEMAERCRKKLGMTVFLDRKTLSKNEITVRISVEL